MGYTKAWVSSVVPARNSLPVWKEMMQEIHANLIESGWVQIDEPGQLISFDSVTVFPTAADYSMFRIYELDDGHQAFGRIFMKVAFSQHDLYRSGVSVSNRKSGIPGCALWISDDITFPSPKTLFCAYPSNGTGGTGNDSSMVYNTGRSMICSNPELGFYGFVYCEGAYTNTDVSYGITRSPFSVIIQRNLVNNEIVHGFSAWTGTSVHSNIAAGYSSKNLRMSEYKASHRFFSTDFVSTIREDSAIRPFTELHTSLPGGVIQISPVYTITPEVKQVPTLVSYIDDQVTSGTQFEAETVGGTRYNFIATGQSCIYADNAAPFAMLFQ